MLILKIPLRIPETGANIAKEQKKKLFIISQFVAIQYSKYQTKFKLW